MYSWIFTDGNAADKAIIARNVLSLHCKYSSLIDIDELAFASMQSNYNLYLRNNVNQYLELKTKWLITYATWLPKQVNMLQLF